jgi:hypothetical protein
MDGAGSEVDGHRRASSQIPLYLFLVVALCLLVSLPPFWAAYCASPHHAHELPSFTYFFFLAYYKNLQHLFEGCFAFVFSFFFAFLNAFFSLQITNAG